MNETNVGILYGSAAMLVGLGAAIAAVYLWRVRRAKERFAPGIAPPSIGSVGLIPWLTPVLLPVAAFLWLVAAVQLWHGCAAGSFWEATRATWPLIGGAYAFGVWQKSRRAADQSHAPVPTAGPASSGEPLPPAP